MIATLWLPIFSLNYLTLSTTQGLMTSLWFWTEELLTKFTAVGHLTHVSCQIWTQFNSQSHILLIHLMIVCRNRKVSSSLLFGIRVMFVPYHLSWQPPNNMNHSQQNSLISQSSDLENVTLTQWMGLVMMVVAMHLDIVIIWCIMMQFGV